MFKRSLYTCWLLCALFTTGVAQLPVRPIFSKLTKKNGLASDIIFNTIQDKQGYIWIATQNGLQRYDGNRFVTFRHIPGDTASLPDNRVNRLFIDQRQRLWVSFDKKIGIFNTTKNSFREAGISIPFMILKKIMQDDKGKVILLVDYNKRLVYDESRNQFVVSYPFPAFPDSLAAGDMIKDPVQDRYWFTGKQGMFLLDKKSGQYSYPGHNVANEPVIEQLVNIKNARLPFVSGDGNFWMVSWIPFGNIPTVYCYDKTTGSTLRFDTINGTTQKNYYEVWGFFQQSNGTLWIYGMNMLSYYNRELKKFIKVPSEQYIEYGIEYDYISQLYEDREHNVWVCSDKGFYRFNQDAQLFTSINNRRPNDTAFSTVPISAVVSTRSKEIWVSTWGNGVYSYNEKWQPLTNPVQGLKGGEKLTHISFMMQRRNGEIWIGSRTGEIFIYDPAANTLTSLQTPLESDDAVRQIAEDSDGTVWVGSNNGVLLKCPGGNWKNIEQSFTTILTDLGDILKIYIDRKNQLWVCTAVNGLYKIDKRNGKVLQQYKESTSKYNGLQNEGATDIVQYNDSLYLVASNFLCILNSNTNSFRYLTAADGLPAENIVDIIPDKQNRLWMALAGGLYRLNLEKKMQVSYDATDGIVTNVFEPSSYTLLPNGNIAIGTQHDLLVFDPSKTIDTAEVPPAVITGINFSGNTISVDSVLQLNKLVLPYDNNSLSIQVSTLSFKNRYRIFYMLEGLDKTWKPLGNSNEIVFPYLPSGDYVLKIKAENGESEPSKKITTLALHVDTPVWKSWWFYSLLILLTGLLLFWFDRMRMKRKEAIAQMRVDIAGKLHSDVSAALDNINVLSEMAKLKADTEPAKSKEFIEQIHAKSGSMINSLNDMLWAISPENDNMRKMLERLKEQAASLSHSFGTSINILVEPNVEQLDLDMKLRQDIYWLLKSGMTNISRLEGKDLRIHIALEKMILLCTLEFRNTRMNLQQFNNLLQRQELESKLKDVKGKLSFETVNENAVIELKVPVP